MQFTLATCFTALAALASAYTPANTAQPPSGNPIGHPGLGELIPAGQTYTITWSPDNGDRVTLLLLRGPSTNVVPILTIAENIPNTGSYTWASVPSTLEADVTGYGIQLIVEGTGTYQYSPQFGVKNDAYTGGASSSSSSSSSTTNTGSSSSSTVTLVSASTSASSSTSRSSGAATASLTSSAPTRYTAGPSAAGTGGNFSVPVISPSRSMSVPSTLQSTPASSVTRSANATVPVPTAVSTGAAAQNLAVHAAALLVAGLAGVLAF